MRARMRVKLRRIGASVVISTVIIAATVLMITVAALSFSNSMLNVQLDNSEYEQAKNMLVTLADMIEDVSASPLSSHYVRYNMRTSRPCFLSGTNTISVTVAGQTVIQGKTGIIEVGGGALASSPGMTNLLGSDCLIVNDVSNPLARVYALQSGGAFAILDYSRVKVTNLGCFYYDDAGNGLNGYLNAVRIAFVNLTIGPVSGSGSVDISVRSLSPALQTTIISSNTVTVTVIVNGVSSQYTVYGLNTIISGGVRYNVIGTILQVLNTQVVVAAK
jgi:hypothetical protein